jgi:hypothetical protein
MLKATITSRGSVPSQDGGLAKINYTGVDDPRGTRNGALFCVDHYYWGSPQVRPGLSTGKTGFLLGAKDMKVVSFQ